MLGAAARTAAELAEVNRNTATYYFYRLQELIFQYQEETTMFSGEIAADEHPTLRGCRAILVGLGKAGGGAVQLIKLRYLPAPFRVGLLKRGGKVYVCIVSDTKTSSLLPIIENKIVPDSIVYTDAYHSYDVLDVSEFKHTGTPFRV